MKSKIQCVMISLLMTFIVSCAPVLNKELTDVAIRDIPAQDMIKHPLAYKGDLFLLGGVIVHTKLTAEGSLIEALYVPVNARGYLQDVQSTHFRYLALFPKRSGMLDPVIFRKDREVTIAGEFSGTRKGKIDEMDYTYPFFVIKEIYLWDEKKEYFMPYPYYDPLWSYPYWHGSPYWWRNPYYPYWW